MGVNTIMYYISPDQLGMWYYLPFALVGLALHFLKVKIKGESMRDIKDYFTTHAKSTLAATLTVIVLLCLFKELGQLNIASALMAGYATDGVWQKKVVEPVLPDCPPEPPGGQG